MSFSSLRFREREREGRERNKKEKEKLTFFLQKKKKKLFRPFSSHHLVTAAVSGGNLYIAHVTIGDKRWFKGAKVDAEGIYNSFTVA